ncbi:MAG: 5-(carboxyamino)imidazole ribonucleotide mutase [Candidatus Aminicenantes bacterium]|nr:5-(carboxyamino)imidazole ribonucleotide mutase [Candidatus Aminicenantes bacterium]
MKVVYFIGSSSDYPVIEPGLEILENFGIEVEVLVTSAHRTPERTVRLVKEKESETDVFVAVAGGAAHLAGFVAAYTTKPVIGLPVAVEPFKGLDSLLSMVQMPRGVPVAVVSAGKWGGVNSALFAAEILSIKYPEIKEKLKEYREKMRKKVEEEFVG